jgi:hypothetical protein
MRVYLLIIIGIIFYVHPSVGQDRDKLVSVANELFHKHQYDNAVRYYLGANEIREDNFVVKRIADCYRLMNQSDEAEIYYEKLQKPEPDTTTFLYAQMLRRNGKYRDARKHFQRLQAAFPDKDIYSRHALYCDSALKWLGERPLLRTVNVFKINSPYSDVTPVGFEDGIVFASNREENIIRKKSSASNQPYFNLFQATRTEVAKFREPVLFSAAINSVHHELAPSFTEDFNKIFFTRVEDHQGSGRNKDKINRPKLYCCERTSLSWSRPLKFILNDSLYSFAHPCIEGSEKMFFFSADIPGGYGGTDIWVSFQVDKKWTDPINLGPVINSPGNEYYPFYHHDGTLYFTSDGHGGMGGFDIFMATQSGGDWVNIYNLKPPVNSSADDFSVYFNSDKTLGYFSSNRPGGLGKEDIYMILRNE